MNTFDRSEGTSKLDKLIDVPDSGSWTLVTQDRVDAFTKATGGHPWDQVDSGQAGTTIVPPYLLLALAHAMVSELLEITGFSQVVDCGCTGVSFQTPIQVGSCLRLSAVLRHWNKLIMGSAELEAVGLEIELQIEVEGQDELACVARVKYHLYK